MFICLLSGCAEKAPLRHYYWPYPPNEPKIEWTGAYESQLDLPVSKFRALRELFVGREDPVLFRKPIDIKSNGRGKVYILDQAMQNVYVYDFNELDVYLLRDPGGPPEIRQLAGLAVTGDGTIYLLDSVGKKIFIFGRDEKPVGEINLDGMVKRPVSLTYDRKQDRLLLCDVGLHQLLALGRDGKLLATYGRVGSNDGEFSYPVAVAVSRGGEIVVADVMNARIQILDANGNFIRKFGRRGDGVSDFQIIKGVAVDSDFNIYVTEGRTSRVMIFSQFGDFLFSLGGQYFTAGTGKAVPGGFMLPQGIDIDEQDAIYVVDQMNQRFQIFQYLQGKK